MRTYADNGLLLYFGRIDDDASSTSAMPHGFLSIAISNGYVELRILNTKNLQVEYLKNDKPIAVGGDWHKIKVKKSGRRLTLVVDEYITSTVCSITDITMHNRSLFHFGGVRDMSKLPYNAVPEFPVHFHGCVSRLVVNNVRVFLNESFIIGKIIPTSNRAEILIMFECAQNRKTSTTVTERPAAPMCAVRMANAGSTIKCVRAVSAREYRMATIANTSDRVTSWAVPTMANVCNRVDAAVRTDFRDITAIQVCALRMCWMILLIFIIFVRRVQAERLRQLSGE